MKVPGSNPGEPIPIQEADGRDAVSEEILGVIDGVKHGRPPRNWSLFVTTDRLIVATVGKAGLGAAFEFGGILMARSRAKRRTETLRERPPAEVLAAHRKNFEIPYGQVREAELDDPEVVVTGTLRVTSPAETHEFTLTNEEGYRAHADLLKAGLKEKLILR